MTLSDTPVPATPKGFLPALLMSLASRMDGGDTPPPFQRVQLMVLLALAIETFYPMMPL